MLRISFEKHLKKNTNDLYKMLESSKDGISLEEAKKRISKYGLNEVDYDKAPSWYAQLLNHSSIHLSLSF